MRSPCHSKSALEPLLTLLCLRQHIMTIKSKLCASMRGVVDSTGNIVHPQTFILEELLEDAELARQGAPVS